MATPPQLTASGDCLQAQHRDLKTMMARGVVEVPIGGREFRDLASVLMECHGERVAANGIGVNGQQCACARALIRCVCRKNSLQVAEKQEMA